MTKYYTNKITSEGTTKVEITGEELTILKAEIADWNSKASERKLELIKQLRLDRLTQTDWYSNSDVTMPDNIKTYRQKMRDLPQDYTTEDEYDLLLARDEQGQLTHSVWSKP